MPAYPGVPEPHDLLIGGDILRLSRLIVDVTTRHFELDFTTG